MDERIDACGANVLVDGQVFGTDEVGARIPQGLAPMLQIVATGIDAGMLDVGVLPEIPVRIEPRRFFENADAAGKTIRPCGRSPPSGDCGATSATQEPEPGVAGKGVAGALAEEGEAVAAEKPDERDGGGGRKFHGWA